MHIYEIFESVQSLEENIFKNELFDFKSQIEFLDSALDNLDVVVESDYEINVRNIMLLKEELYKELLNKFKYFVDKRIKFNSAEEKWLCVKNYEDTIFPGKIFKRIFDYLDTTYSMLLLKRETKFDILNIRAFCD
jgi:hypothetical protein